MAGPAKTQFDPNGPGIPGNIYGLPFSKDDADIVLLPVPWEATVSYHQGSSQGPHAILEASSQIDVFSKQFNDVWKCGICMLPIPYDIQQESSSIQSLVKQQVRRYESGEKTDLDDPLVKRINEACETLNIYVKQQTQKFLQSGKIIGLVGGDHSTPLGFLRALGEKYNSFSILHIDAHADLRRAFQGLLYSHGSIMYNALKIPSVRKLVQVGIRDVCEEEMAVIERSLGRITPFFDEDLKSAKYQGRPWEEICDDIIATLPANVYISFDIDGLDPKLCPNTGTPVPGGLEFYEAVHLIRKIALSGKKIIGFDLNEVAPGPSNDWDANVGARMLLQLCIWTAVSQGKLELKEQSL
jgi:agmatinase